MLKMTRWRLAVTTPKDRIANAYQWALANRPKVNGFPHLAEALRQAGAIRYIVTLPSCQTIYFTNEGSVVAPTEALVKGLSEVPHFNRDAFVAILRKSQAGETTFPEFLKGTWENGVIHYEADLISRKVSYYGSDGESYTEDYPAVTIHR